MFRKGDKAVPVCQGLPNAHVITLLASIGCGPNGGAAGAKRSQRLEHHFTMHKQFFTTVAVKSKMVAPAALFQYQ